MIEPTINPTDSAVITRDQDLAPLKCSKAINGPKTFSAAASHGEDQLTLYFHYAQLLESDV
jgi:hypothetical protein